MIDYFYFFIKIVIIQIINNTLPTKLILSCVFLFFLGALKYYLKKTHTKFTIEDFHIIHISDIIPFILSFCCVYILGLLYLRFCNFGNVLDLIVLYDKLVLFFSKEKLNYIVITLSYNILFTIIFIVIIIKLMKSIKFHLFKIHIYILSYFPLGFLKITPYTKVTLKIQRLYLLLSNVFCVPYHKVSKYITIYILKQEYNCYKISGFETFLYKIRDKNALIVLILIIFYDIFVNNFVLTKMYFFLPIVFLCNLIKIIDNIISLLEPYEESVVVSHLYCGIKKFNIKTFEILYMNNIEVTIQELKNVEVKLNQEFT